MNTVVKILPNGDVMELYNDAGLLSDIPGTKKVRRASNVVFDEDSQTWFIYFLRYDAEVRFPFGFVKRVEAIEKEKELLKHMMVSGLYVEEVFNINNNE